MGIISSTIVKIAIKVERWIFKNGLNNSNVFKGVATSHARIIANEIFEKNTVMENAMVSFYAIEKISHTDCTIFDENTNVEQVVELHSLLKSNKNIMSLMAEYALAQAHNSKHLPFTNRKKEAEERITTASIHNQDMEPFNKQSFKIRLKEVKAELKTQQKLLNDIFKNKITKEKAEVIGEISIKTTDIAILFSIFSSLFLISGYYYTNSFLAKFHINSDDFYLISDYISTSISFVLTPLLWAGIYLIGILLSANDKLAIRIKEEQLNIKLNNEIPKALPLIIISMNILNIIFMLKGHYHAYDMTLTTNILLILIFLTSKVSFHYFKKPLKVYIAIFICIGFIYSLTSNVNREIQRITSEEYQPEYLVAFKNETVNEEVMEFITINSNYIIMRNSISKSISIYPKSYIHKLTPNPQNIEKLTFIEKTVEDISTFINQSKSLPR